MQKIKKVINSIPKTYKNKYLLTLVFFTFWIIFIDDYNLIKQYQLQKEVNNLENKKRYYISEIKKDSTEFYHLKNTPSEQERFAREKFFMKKDNEDIFIIRTKKDE